MQLEKELFEIINKPHESCESPADMCPWTRDT